MLLTLTAPADNVRGPRYMQEALAAIHQANRRRLSFTLEYAVHNSRVGMFFRVPDELAALVGGPLKAKYPNCALKKVASAEALDPPRLSQAQTWTSELVLSPDLFPLLRHSQFEDMSSKSFEDPIDALLQAIAPNPQTHGRIQIHIRPTSRRRHRRARRGVAKLDLPRLRASDDRMQRYARFIMHPVLWPLAWLSTLRAGSSDARFADHFDGLLLGSRPATRTPTESKSTASWEVLATFATSAIKPHASGRGLHCRGPARSVQSALPKLGGFRRIFSGVKEDTP